MDKERDSLQNTEALHHGKAAMPKKAILFIQVDIELGLAYEGNAELFDQVFKESGLTKDEALSFKRRFAQKPG